MKAGPLELPKGGASGTLKCAQRCETHDSIAKARRTCLQVGDARPNAPTFLEVFDAVPDEFLWWVDTAVAHRWARTSTAWFVRNGDRTRLFHPGWTAWLPRLRAIAAAHRARRAGVDAQDPPLSALVPAQG